MSKGRNHRQVTRELGQTGERPRLHGLNHTLAPHAIDICKCGGVQYFDTDALGGSIMRCRTCGVAQPLTPRKEN